VGALSKGTTAVDKTLHVQPVTMCISFLAQTNAGIQIFIGPFIPLGFEATYTVEYKVWSQEVLSTQ
jgi:hypothetical protein